MQLPERLKELRKETKATQDDIAALLKIRRSTYGEYERGKIRPPAGKLFALAEHYGVTVDYLMGIAETRQRPQNAQSDVREHLSLFINWLRNPEARPTMDGQPLEPAEREIIAAALQNARNTARDMIGILRRNPNNPNKPEQRDAPSEQGE